MKMKPAVMRGGGGYVQSRSIRVEIGVTFSIRVGMIGT